jgi:hypothetical protein
LLRWGGVYDAGTEKARPPGFPRPAFDCVREIKNGLEKPAAARMVALTTKTMYTGLVYTRSMKNITFSADADLIGKARERARREHKTLNTAFREWLDVYAGVSTDRQDFDNLMQSLRHVRVGRKFTRDEMNAR